MHATTPAEIAWGHVADGFAAALWIDGLDEQTTERLLDGYRITAVMAGRLDHIEALSTTDRAHAERMRCDCRKITEAWQETARIARGTDGVDHVIDCLELASGPQVTAMRNALFKAGIGTIEQARRRLQDGSITDVRNMGSKRVELLRQAFVMYDATRA